MSPGESARPPGNRIRVLVVDDSAFNRQTITHILENSLGIEVVGRAADGEEGLKLAFSLQPDVITLDLEMPKMDGFAFLRLLMARRPTPVIVISGYATKENVFKALELGALDFVAKPSRQISAELRSIADELGMKVRLATQLRSVSSLDRSRLRAAEGGTPPPPGDAARPAAAEPAAGRSVERVLAIGASTGGPPAIQQVLAALDPGLPLGIVITQHMPLKFTRAFAERLDRMTPWRVKEAEDGDVIEPGRVLVAPGSGSLTIRRSATSSMDVRFSVAVEPPRENQRFTPSINRMFESAAEAIGDRLIALVLTGMGGDGAAGVRAVRARKGATLAEAPETAVIFGMPEECIATGAIDEIVPLGNVAATVRRLLRGAAG